MTDKFKMSTEDDVVSLSEKTYSSLFTLFNILFENIKTGKNIFLSNEKWGRKPYTRKELEKLCTIKPNMEIDEIKKVIRCTYFPGAPAPYIELDKYKFEFNPKR